MIRFKQFLTEKYTKETNELGNDYEIYVDPNSTELKACFRKSEYNDVRFLTTYDHIYIWPAEQGLHDRVIMQLGLLPKYHLSIGSGGLVMDEHGRLSLEYGDKLHYKNETMWNRMLIGMNLSDNFLKDVHLNEKYNRLKSDFGSPLDLYTNPSPDEFAACLNKAKYNHDIRGAVSLKGDLYIWPADQAIHASVLDALDISDDFTFMLNGGTQPEVWNGSREGLYKNEMFLRMIRKNPIMVKQVEDYFKIRPSAPTKWTPELEKIYQELQA